MNVNIREATMKDFEKINELMQDLLGDPIFERKKVFDEALSSENYMPLVAEVNEDIVGFLDIWNFPDIGHGATLGIIENFIVSERHRKICIGAKLLEESVEIARNQKFHELHVWTEFKN